MPYRAPAATTHRSPRVRVVGVLLVAVAIAAALGLRALASSPSPAASPLVVVRNDHRGPLGEADGAVPDGTTIFDEWVPGVANLDPALLGALRRSAAAAAADGVGFVVDSGWRSPAYQERLLREAVAKYGSAEEAARWVATPTASAHVSGDAVDIGHSDAAAWLSQHGAGYGLCQIYNTEPWHFELRPEAVEHGCPARYADAAHDPRMRR